MWESSFSCKIHFVKCLLVERHDPEVEANNRMYANILRAADAVRAKSTGAPAHFLQPRTSSVSPTAV